MNYYIVAVIGQKLTNFYTYQSPQVITPLSIVEVLFNHRIKNALLIEETTKPEAFDCFDIERITGDYLSDEQYEMARFISQYYCCTLSETLGIFYPFEQMEAVKDEPELTCDEFISTDNIELSPSQQEALAFCLSNRPALLFGDTGSGKTEIYIKAMLSVLQRGKKALMLMPEIALTPQMERRLTQYFGDSVGIWHSKLTKKKRQLMLEHIQSGQIKVIAGARSSLFLPINDLGIIVVDEEHEEAYKAIQTPFYQARDVAVYMAKKLDIPIILGSATPSLLSYAKYPHYRLKGGFFSAPKDFIFTEQGIDDEKNDTILNEIRASLERSEQVIVFVPTKANFQYLICKDCQKVVSCPYCSISLSLYIQKKMLLCHYCNYREGISSRCKSCQSDALHSKKIGTAQVVELLKGHFEKATIEAFDRDEVSTNKKLKETLKRFRDKETDILVGTQMISKGHDYHNVALAVVLNIDSILYMQDYKAREKALSLLLQVAGRAGRKALGKVVISTTNGDFFRSYIGDYQLFLDDEIRYREGFYPPFKRLARVNFSSKNPKKAHEQMKKMQKKLSQIDDIDIIGFGESPIRKIALKYRYHIFIRSDKPTHLLKALYYCKSDEAVIDIDPVTFT